MQHEERDEETQHLVREHQKMSIEVNKLKSKLYDLVEENENLKAQKAPVPVGQGVQSVLAAQSQLKMTQAKLSETEKKNQELLQLCQELLAKVPPE